MAYHFSANQFEDKYSPRKLGNWEYPKWYPDRPRQRFKSTQIIADDQGRLLEGIKRGNAWGNYVGTWDLPRRITREYIKQLVAPPERLKKLWEKTPECQKRSNQSEKKHPEDSNQETCIICERLLRDCTCEKLSKASSSSLDEVEKCGEPLSCPKCKNEICLCQEKSLDHVQTSQRSFQRRNKSSSALDLKSSPTKLEPLVTENVEEKKLCNYSITPVYLDDKIKSILDSVEKKSVIDTPSKELCKELKSLPRHSKEKLKAANTFDSCKNLEQSSNFLTYLDEHLKKYEEIDDETNTEKNGNKQITVPKEQQFEAPREDSVNLNMKENLQKESKSPCPVVHVAKKYHEENLRHKPLPDVIDDPVYKALTSGNKPHPGGSLNVQGMPSAVGWKCYSVPGPTECSKLKVYRPKTALEEIKLQKDGRPKTSEAKDRTKKRFLPIDLAICWDLKPEDPSDEPKRSPHIDGSNGCVAPAVFTMVQSKETSDEPNSLSSCEAITQKISKGIKENNLANVPSQITGKLKSPLLNTVNKEAIMACIKSSPKQKENVSPTSTNSISTNAAEYARKNPKTAWSNEDTSKALSSKLLHLQETAKRKSSTEEGKQNLNQWDCEQIQMSKKKHYQSTPNLVTTCEGSHCGTDKSSTNSSKISKSSKNRSLVSLNTINGESDIKHDKKSKAHKIVQKTRNCLACEKLISQSDDNHEKSEFKMAFKAGVPKSESSHSGCGSVAKSYKVPKMRLPYAKKNYFIGTLIPPFSSWPDSNGQEYPEHWRLASVYQHSYKPINTRKRPMLASVYQ